MVALDNAALLGQPVRAPRLRFSLAPLVGAVALGAAMIVMGAVFTRGFTDNGFRLGSQLAWRYTSLVFFAAMVAGPLCRIAARFVPSFTAPESLGRKLVWGFCASYAIYLLSVFVPNVIDVSAGATLMVLFGAGVALVMAVTVMPLRRHGRAVMAERLRRTFLGTATSYFWLCYALMGLAHISGPHRPDAFYGISLCLMVAALLVRYADHWVSPANAARSQVATI
jgi:hypothetical protein